jgi:hypothetical protein
MAKIRRYSAMPLGLLVSTMFTCAFTSPAVGATVTQGTPVTITGALSAGAAVVQVKLGSTLLGSAAIDGLTWSYTWTPQSGDIGAQTLNAVATAPSGAIAVAPGVAITVASGFTGDFAALAVSFGLTVRAHYRSDLGVSGTTGAGKTTWANQSGSASAVTVTGSQADGIGTPGAAVNGMTSLVLNGTSQAGAYTMPAQSAPATTNFHKWWVGRQTAFSSANWLLFGSQCGAINNDVTPKANIYQYNSGLGANVSGAVINQWYRGYLSYTGSASDTIRYGAHTASGATSNTAPSTSRSIACDLGGTNRVAYEFLDLMELEGTQANFFLFDAAAGPAARTFWALGSALEI